MRKQLFKIRKELVAKLWEEKKAVLTMQDIAEIFSMGVGTVFRYLKEAEKKVDKKKIKH